MDRKIFAKKTVTLTFATIAFFLGLWFLDFSFTGNLILNGQSRVNPLSLIGLVLIGCCTILFFYSIKKK